MESTKLGFNVENTKLKAAIGEIQSKNIKEFLKKMLIFDIGKRYDWNKLEKEIPK